jgi:hypothetical protein
MDCDTDVLPVTDQVQSPCFLSPGGTGGAGGGRRIINRIPAEKKNYLLTINPDIKDSWHQMINHQKKLQSPAIRGKADLINGNER